MNRQFTIREQTLLWSAMLGTLIGLLAYLLLQGACIPKHDKAALGVDPWHSVPTPDATTLSSSDRVWSPAPEAAPSIGEVVQTVRDQAELAWPSYPQDGGSNPPLAATPHDLAQLDESYAVTPEGLAEYTFEHWLAHEGFVDLTVAEAEALLGESLGTYPGTMQELLGGYPTLLDCDEALKSEEVKQYLRELILLDAELVKIGMQEIDGRGPTPGTQKMKELAQAAKDGVELRLWRKLDEVTGYKSWSVLGRLFRGWSRPKQ